MFFLVIVSLVSWLKHVSAGKLKLGVGYSEELPQAKKMDEISDFWPENEKYRIFQIRHCKKDIRSTLVTG